MRLSEIIEQVQTEFNRNGFVYLQKANLTPEDLVAIAESCGTVIPIKAPRLTPYLLPEANEITVISNIVNSEGRPTGILGSDAIPWHNDGSHIPYRMTETKLSFAAINYCVKSDDFCTTTWMNLAELLKNIPKEIRDKLAKCTAKHSTQSKLSRYKTLEESIHPLIRFHPVFRCEYLYPSPQFLAEINGWDTSEDAVEMILHLIEEYGASTIPVKWRAGDLVVHDTQLFMHKRTHLAADRNMWRVDFRLHENTK